MRPNRQNTYHRPTFNQTKIVAQHQNHYFSQKNKHLNPNNQKIYIIDLIQQSKSHEITLNCHTKLSIKRQKNIRKDHKTDYKNDNYHQKHKQQTYVHAKNRSQNLLKKCFDDIIQHKMAIQYVFSSKLPSNTNNFGSIHKKSGFINNTNFNSIKNKISTRDFITDQKIANQNNKYTSRSKQNTENKNQFKQIMKKNKKYDTQPPNMFTVEQIGQSIQQDGHQAKYHIKSFMPIKIKPHLNEVTNKNDLLFNKNKEINQQIQFLLENKDVKTKSDINNFQNANRIESLDINKQNQLFNSIQIQKKSSQKQKQAMPIQRFSFAKQIKQGIIEHQPFKNHKWQSFKLIDDEQLQNEKKNMKNMIQLPLMSQMNQQISSIISSNMKQTNKKQGQFQLDSIKLDLQNYNASCMNINTKKQADKILQAQSSKIQQIKYVMQGGQQINDLVEITKKSTENNKNEFHVKYNFRFLQKNTKSNAQQVIRISPLKFRKKQEVVKHFMEANIIQKQSSSINIP